MKYSSEQLDEINTLLLFDTQNPLDGIKAHSNANPETIAAVKRLFDKDLITQVDGGYLTDLGKKSAEHAHSLLGLLK
ncbi:MAG: TIGR02647 family protein [Thiotrichaceae bacterium]